MGARLAREVTAGQLFVAADRVPFVGPGLPPLVLRGFTCQCRWHVKARGRLNKRTLAGRVRALSGPAGAGTKQDFICLPPGASASIGTGSSGRLRGQLRRSSSQSGLYPGARCRIAASSLAYSPHGVRIRYHRAMTSESVIHSDPEILGGTPVFVGTRVP